MTTVTTSARRARVDGAAWAQLAADLDEFGCAALPPLLTASECANIAGLCDDASRFRATIDMGRHRSASGCGCPIRRGRSSSFAVGSRRYRVGPWTA